MTLVVKASASDREVLSSGPMRGKRGCTPLLSQGAVPSTACLPQSQWPPHFPPKGCSGVVW